MQIYMQTIKICRGFQVPQHGDLNQSHDSNERLRFRCQQRRGKDCLCGCVRVCVSVCVCMWALWRILLANTSHTHTPRGGGGKGIHSAYLANVCAERLFALHIFSPLEAGVCVCVGVFREEGEAWHSLLSACLLFAMFAK